MKHNKYHAKNNCFDFVAVKIKAVARYEISSRDLLRQRLALKTLFVEDGVPTQLDDTPQGFEKDAAIHFARAQDAIDEHDGNFLDDEAHAVGCEFHLYLERIALELDAIQIDGLQHLTAIAHIARRRVTHLHARNQAHIG